ncbi:MAG: D-amino-acid transaminase [Rhodospirillales bacterium]
MSRIAYVDGRFLPHRRAGVSVEDRGYQFADGVYEVIAVKGGRPVDEEPHLDRLARSLDAVRIGWPMSRAALRLVMREVIRRNRVGDFGALYLQITRGTAPRNHAFPAGVSPVLVMTARPLPPFDFAAARRGVAVIAAPDERWHRPDIKSVSLLPNVLAKQRAVEAGAYEAWLLDPAGMVTEGTASNAWIVSADGVLVTRSADHSILAGITRAVLLQVAAEHDVRLERRPFSLEEAKRAREAFITSTTSWVKAVVRIDDAPIGDGGAGPLTSRLLDWYGAHVAGSRGDHR